MIQPVLFFTIIGMKLVEKIYFNIYMWRKNKKMKKKW